MAGSAAQPTMFIRHLEPPPNVKADQQGAEDDLGYAKREHVAAETAELVQLDFQSDQKKHQNDADLSEFVHRQDRLSRYVSHLSRLGVGSIVAFLVAGIVIGQGWEPNSGTRSARSDRQCRT